MACPTIETGRNFLAGTLANIDCQAQTLGSYGYLSLAQPGSVASLTMTGLLTLFVGFLGLRLLFGPAPTGGDAVRDLLKIAVVLTLAFSWPAWRTVIYDVTLKGPAEIAAAITPPTLPQASGFADRLQNIDTGMIALTVRGTGRSTGELTEETAPPAGFKGVALQDETGFATARLIFLSGTIGSLAILRLAAGLLLALTPLAAGLLLFEATRGLFSGWLRGLVLTVIGSVGVSIVLAAEMVLLEPLLQDALRLRDLGYATPATPTELVALTAGFGLALFGMLILLGRVAFQPGWLNIAVLLGPARFPSGFRASAEPASHAAVLPSVSPSRAFLLSERMADVVRRERQGTLETVGREHRSTTSRLSEGPAAASARESGASGGQRLRYRTSSAATRRDERS